MLWNEAFAIGSNSGGAWPETWEKEGFSRASGLGMLRVQVAGLD